MPIIDMLRRNAGLYGDEVALVEVNPEVFEPRPRTWREYDLIEPAQTQAYRREISWKVFDEKANRFANLLLSRGVKKGDKVAILLMNCIDWLPIYFGILKTGAIAVPLNFRYTASEIAYCVSQADVDILVFGEQFKGRIEELIPRIQKNRLLLYVGDGCPDYAESYHLATANCPSNDPWVPISEDDDAAIYFSSGTTGYPKAILHHHLSLTQSAELEQAHHGQTHDDVFLCIPPLYHTGAKMHWFGSLLVGGKAVLLRGVTPKSVFDAVSDEGCTVVWLLVPWAQDILAALERGEIKLEDYKLEQWRLMHIGAQPVPKNLIERWKSIFPNHDYDTNYGLSESCGPGCVHLGIENIDRVGAIGVAGYRWEAKVVDADGNEVERGTKGELCVKGPGIMQCYYNDPESSAEVLKGKWLLTGDIAYQDEDGFFWLVDRKKDLVISGGENIYPVQVEDFLSAHPAIHDVAVIGIPDERLGEIAIAIVELKRGMDNTTQDDIEEFCLGLPRYKRPRKIIFAPVPRNPTGKIEKPLLRETYGKTSAISADESTNTSAALGAPEA